MAMAKVMFKDAWDGGKEEKERKKEKSDNEREKKGVQEGREKIRIGSFGSGISA